MVLFPLYSLCLQGLLRCRVRFENVNRMKRLIDIWIFYSYPMPSLQAIGPVGLLVWPVQDRG